MKEEIKTILQKLNEMSDECDRIAGLWNGDESGHLEEQADEYKDIKFWLDEAIEKLINARDVREII